MQRGQKRVRRTNSREMLLQEAGEEDKRAADTTAEEDGKGGTASGATPAEAASQGKSSPAFRQECPRKPPPRTPR